MALNANTVGTAIANIVKNAAPAAGTAITDAVLLQMWKDIAAAILTGSGGVTSATVAVTVTSVSGVTTGGGVSGPGSGTGTIS
jgi:hypothetical protein